MEALGGATFPGCRKRRYSVQVTLVVIAALIDLPVRRRAAA
jgi:hypothetical protein